MNAKPTPASALDGMAPIRTPKEPRIALGHEENAALLTFHAAQGGGCHVRACADLIAAFLPFRRLLHWTYLPSIKSLQVDCVGRGKSGKENPPKAAQVAKDPLFRKCVENALRTPLILPAEKSVALTDKSVILRWLSVGLKSHETILFPVHNDDGASSCLAFALNSKSPEQTRRQRLLARFLYSHLRVGLRRRAQDVKRQRMQNIFASLLKNAPVGILILDKSLVPLYANHLGVELCQNPALCGRKAVTAAPNGSVLDQAPSLIRSACLALREGITTGESTDSVREIYRDDQLDVSVRILSQSEKVPVSPLFVVHLRQRRSATHPSKETIKVPVSLSSFDLTAREREIALLIYNGLGNKQIADRLGKSYHTVKNQTKSIYRKAGVANRMQLLALLGSPPPAEPE